MPDKDKIQEKNKLNIKSINPNIHKNIDLKPFSESFNFVGTTPEGKNLTLNSQYDTKAIDPDFYKTEGFIEERRAQLQDNWDKAANGFARFGGRAVTSILDGTAGLIYGGAKLAFQQAMEPAKMVEHLKNTGTLEGYKSEAKFNTLFNNEVTNALDESYSSFVENTVPLYRTFNDKSTTGFARLGQANTWFGDVADGLGFVAGSVATGSLTSNLVKTLTKASALGMIDDIVNDVSKITKTEDKLKYIKEASRKINIKDAATKTVVGAASAHSEAGMEAREAGKSFAEKMIYDLTHDLTGKKVREITEEELNEINKLREDVELSTYSFNLPIIAGTNMAQFGKAMLSTKASDNALFNASKYGNKIKKNSSGIYEPISNNLNKLEQTGKNISRIVTNPLEETFQEGSQFAISKATEDFYINKFYDPEKSNFIDALNSAEKGIRETLGSEEGFQSMLIGGVIGFLGSGSSAIRGKKPEFIEDWNKEKKEIEGAVDFLNKYKTSDVFKETIQSAIRHEGLLYKQEKALKNQDNFEYQNTQQELMTNYVLSRIATGKIDELYQELEELKNLDVKEFEKYTNVKLGDNQYGIAEDRFNVAKNNVTDFINDRISKVKQIENVVNNIETIFPETSKGNKERLINSAINITDAKNRKVKLANEINNAIQSDILSEGLDSPLNFINNDKLITSSKEELINIKKQIQKSKISPLIKDNILDKIDDLSKLKEREQKFVDIYTELKLEKVQKAFEEKDTKKEEEFDEKLEKVVSGNSEKDLAKQKQEEEALKKQQNKAQKAAEEEAKRKAKEEEDLRKKAEQAANESQQKTNETIITDSAILKNANKEQPIKIGQKFTTPTGSYNIEQIELINGKVNSLIISTEDNKQFVLEGNNLNAVLNNAQFEEITTSNEEAVKNAKKDFINAFLDDSGLEDVNTEPTGEGPKKAKSSLDKSQEQYNAIFNIIRLTGLDSEKFTFPEIWQELITSPFEELNINKKDFLTKNFELIKDTVSFIQKKNNKINSKLTEDYILNDDLTISLPGENIEPPLTQGDVENDNKELADKINKNLIENNIINGFKLTNSLSIARRDVEMVTLGDEKGAEYKDKFVNGYLQLNEFNILNSSLTPVGTKISLKIREGFDRNNKDKEYLDNYPIDMYAIVNNKEYKVGTLHTPQYININNMAESLSEEEMLDLKLRLEKVRNDILSNPDTEFESEITFKRRGFLNKNEKIIQRSLGKVFNTDNRILLGVKVNNNIILPKNINAIENVEFLKNGSTFILIPNADGVYSAWYVNKKPLSNNEELLDKLTNAFDKLFKTGNRDPIISKYLYTVKENSLGKEGVLIKADNTVNINGVSYNSASPEFKKALGEVYINVNKDLIEKNDKTYINELFNSGLLTTDIQQQKEFIDGKEVNTYFHQATTEFSEPKPTTRNIQDAFFEESTNKNDVNNLNKQEKNTTFNKNIADKLGIDMSNLDDVYEDVNINITDKDEQVSKELKEKCK